MSYNGKTYQIRCDQGGFNSNANTDQIPPSSFVHPSRNINLHRGVWETRGGTEKINSTAVSGVPRLMGIYDFRLKNGNSFQAFMGSDGKIYRDYLTVLKTGMSVLNHAWFETFDDELYIADGATIPQTWNGVAGSTSDITTPALDWAASNQPSQFVKHGRGASERLWACGCSSNLESVYYSSLGNGQQFAGGTSGKLAIETADGFGIVGVIEIGNELVAFGKRKAYRIDDSNSATANWGYVAAQWEGGAAHQRLIIKTPNDVICMMEDGEIYSVTAVQSYGDYKAASIARPSHLHNWIKENVKLSAIADFHGIYDPALRAVKIFVVRNGKTTVDTALVYYIDRPADQAWSIHDNQNAASGYSASCAALVRTTVGDYQIYTGDYSGFIWKLEQITTSDSGSGYYNGVKVPVLNFDDPRANKLFKRGYVVANTQGNFNLQVKIWVDGNIQNSTTVSLAGTGAPIDSFILDTDLLGGTEFIDRFFDIGAKGKRIQFEFYLTTAGQKFVMSQVLIDFKPLSVRP